VANPPGQLHEIAQDRDFLVQLGERAGGGRSVHHAVFSLLAFVAGQLVQIVFGDLDGAPELSDAEGDLGTMVGTMRSG